MSPAHERSVRIAIILASVCWALSVFALEFRTINPIGSSEFTEVLNGQALRALCQPVSCAGLIANDPIIPVKKSLINKVAQKVGEAWNSSELGRFLAEEFFDKSRLLDTLRESVPRDARMRVLSVRDVQTLRQYAQPPNSSPRYRFSLVSARIRTQVEYNNPSSGFVRSKPDTQEYLLVIRERYDAMAK